MRDQCAGNELRPTALAIIRNRRSHLWPWRFESALTVELRSLLGTNSDNRAFNAGVSLGKLI